MNIYEYAAFTTVVANPKEVSAEAWDAYLLVGLVAEIGEDANLSRDVVRVLSSAVIRVLKNPDGKRQESIDDYSWTRDNAVSAGVLYFTDAELNDLAPGAGGTGGAFSVNLLAGWSPE